MQRRMQATSVGHHILQGPPIKSPAGLIIIKAYQILLFSRSRGLHFSRSFRGRFAATPAYIVMVGAKEPVHISCDPEAFLQDLAMYSGAISLELPKSVLQVINIRDDPEGSRPFCQRRKDQTVMRGDEISITGGEGFEMEHKRRDGWIVIHASRIDFA